MSRKSIILFSICCLAAFLSIIIYFLSDNHAEKAVPVIVTLSSDQLLGVGYTDAVAADNSDIWEDSDFSYSGKSSGQETSSVSAVSFPIDINIATADELIQIKGIGSATAENIISYRNAHGSFHSVDELTNVDGIGSKKLSDMKDYIYVDPEIAEQASETTSSDNFSAEASQTSLSDSEIETTITSVFSENPTETQNSPEAGIVFPIELNTASAEELMAIDGIGEVLADAIVEYAQSTGFSSKSDLMNVPGIGKKRFEAISPYVYVE